MFLGLNFSIFGAAAQQECCMHENSQTRCSFGRLGQKHQKDWWSSLFQIGVDRRFLPHYQIIFIADRLFHRFLSKSTYVSETNVYGVLLATDSNNLGLDIEIRLKNRRTGNFSNYRFFIGHNSSGEIRYLRPRISGLWNFEGYMTSITRHGDTHKQENLEPLLLRPGEP